ncbi:MAG: hypothetical protein AAFY99_11415 [Pseudomonadota bacterium]
MTLMHPRRARVNKSNKPLPLFEWAAIQQDKALSQSMSPMERLIAAKFGSSPALAKAVSAAWQMSGGSDD